MPQTADIAWKRPVCQLDSQGFYTGQAEAELDVYAKDGSYLIPGGCIDTAPPEIRDGFAACWNKDAQSWDYIADLRGKTAYRTDNGLAVQIAFIGSLDDVAAAHRAIYGADGDYALTLQAPPSAAHEWDGKQWRENAERAAEIAAGKLAQAKRGKLAALNAQAQDFIGRLAELDETPEFEIQTWTIQAAEAKAWHADPSAPTPTLDTIAAARGVPAELLKQKAYEKTVRYELATAHIVGLRQRYQDAIAAAENAEAVEAMAFEFALPQAV